jgi:hypothetical protein
MSLYKEWTIVRGRSDDGCIYNFRERERESNMWVLWVLWVLWGTMGSDGYYAQKGRLIVPIGLARVL